ncbi:MAG: glutaredoxin family protein [Deltaproteobacteria bacterium]|nr:glutaredoxin family protein [Deltaproteobacteria bacterium]
MKDAKPLPEISVIPPASKPVKYNDGLYNETATNKKIEIFVTSWCPYCKKLLASLDANGIAYTKYDIEKDSNARAVYKSLGGGGVPLTRIGSTTVRGNNPEAIMRLGR